MVGRRFLFLACSWSRDSHGLYSRNRDRERERKRTGKNVKGRRTGTSGTGEGVFARKWTRIGALCENEKVTKRKVKTYIYTHRHKYVRHERGGGGRGGGGGVEINSLHPKDRYDTPRKYSTALEIDTTVNLSASPAALCGGYAWRRSRGASSILSLFRGEMMTRNLRRRTVRLLSRSSF